MQRNYIRSVRLKMPVDENSYLHSLPAVRHLSQIEALTKTHGRHEAAFLNRAWEDVLAADIVIDPAIERLRHALHTEESRP